MALSTPFRQCAPDTTKFGKITQNQGHFAVQFHSSVNLFTYGGRAFAYAGSTSWNSLPDNLKNVNLSLQSFKRHLKTFFFSSY